jgi:hypothetical protein
VRIYDGAVATEVRTSGRRWAAQVLVLWGVQSGCAALGVLNPRPSWETLGVAALLGLTALPEGGTSGGFLAVTTAAVATAI